MIPCRFLLHDSASLGDHTTQYTGSGLRSMDERMLCMLKDVYIIITIIKEKKPRSIITIPIRVYYFYIRIATTTSFIAIYMGMYC